MFKLCSDVNFNCVIMLCRYTILSVINRYYYKFRVYFNVNVICIKLIMSIRSIFCRICVSVLYNILFYIVHILVSFALNYFSH